MDDNDNSREKNTDRQKERLRERESGLSEDFHDDKRNDEKLPESDEEYQKRMNYYLKRLEDDNEGIRWTAAESLGRLLDPAAVEVLIDTLWDDDARVRMKAAWALGQIGDRRALRPLEQLYLMENENVKEIVEKAINELKRRMSAQVN